MTPSHRKPTAETTKPAAETTKPFTKATKPTCGCCLFFVVVVVVVIVVVVVDKIIHNYCSLTSPLTPLYSLLRF